MAIKIPAGLSRFFTLKTEHGLNIEARDAINQKRVLDTPHGLRSFIDDQQQAVNDMRAKTDAFLTDIETHFGDAAKYLTPAYTGRTKFENVENGRRRRIGVQWHDRVYTFDDCFITTISFAYTEVLHGVRVDYILKRQSGPKEIINDDYDPESDKIYKTRNNCDDSFRTIRRYEDHKDFVNSGHRVPQWFVDALSTRRPTSTPA